MKTWVKYFISCLLSFISYPIYMFVSYPNGTDGDSWFVINAKNILIYEVIPFAVASLCTFGACWIYLRLLPSKKSPWFLIPEILNILFIGCIAWLGIFVWTGTSNWYGGQFIVFVSVILLGLAMWPILIRFKRK